MQIIMLIIDNLSYKVKYETIAIYSKCFMIVTGTWWKKYENQFNFLTNDDRRHKITQKKIGVSIVEPTQKVLLIRDRQIRKENTERNHVGNFERFFAIASSTAFNCFNSSSRLVAADFLLAFSAFWGDGAEICKKNGSLIWWLSLRILRFNIPLVGVELGEVIRQFAFLMTGSSLLRQLVEARELEQVVPFPNLPSSYSL